jgi:hypothetical protein
MNLREIFSKYPLDCESFNAEWQHRWSEVGRLLEFRAQIEHWLPWREEWLRMADGPMTAADCLAYCAEYDGQMVRCRVVLLDGTVVKEWGAI